MPWTIDRMSENVALVTMRTNKPNAQNPAFFDDLHRTFDRLEREFGDCAVVLTGQGQVFSAGLDFDHHFPMFARRSVREVDAWFDTYRATNLRLFAYPRPTIAAINGHAYAGGLITALGCDIRIAAEGDLQFALNEVPIGIPMPAVYCEIIRYAVGTHVATEMSLFGQVYTFADAVRMNLVHRVVPATELIDEAVRWAGSVQRGCQTAYAMTKRALQAATMRAIDHARRLDLDQLSRGMTDPDSLKAHARRYRELKGREPNWGTANEQMPLATSVRSRS
jgi:enoyl-CoA hydratase